MEAITKSYNYFAIWLAGITGYVTIILLSPIDFDLTWFIAISNLLLLPLLLMKWNKRSIADPIAYVQFSAGMMHIGKDKIPVNSIDRVALECIGDQGYFSLPYNQLAPGVIPELKFPASKMGEFREYIIAKLDDSIEIVT